MRTHDSTLRSDPLRLRDARRWLVRLILESGYAAGDAHDLAVAFGEICANVHRHAYRGRRDGRVGIRIAIAADSVVVTVDHDGEPFDADAYAPPDLRRPSESGYGLYLIKSLVDAVSFERAHPGERVVLVKRRSEGGIRREAAG